RSECEILAQRAQTVKEIVQQIIHGRTPCSKGICNMQVRAAHSSALGSKDLSSFHFDKIFCPVLLKRGHNWKNPSQGLPLSVVAQVRNTNQKLPFRARRLSYPAFVRIRKAIDE